MFFSRSLLCLPRLRSIPRQSIRKLHLAPPFLVDNYIPRYQQISSVDAAKKRASAYAHLRNCNLCPRLCGVNRFETTGVCLIGAETVKVNTIAPHFGEEPCIQGHNGSGSVFFSGCNMRCVFCQNYDIAHQRNGFDLTPTQLAEWFVKLQDTGNVHNINLVTPEHIVPQVVLSILDAKDMGLEIPIVYNTSAFDSLDSLELLDGLIDIYLPDFKVWNNATSRRLLKVDDYASAAKESIQAMHAQVGDLCFTPDGLACSGLLVRHLVMPKADDEGAEIMQWLANDLSSDTFVHIMDQYRPAANVGKPRRRGVGTKNPGKNYATDTTPTTLEEPSPTDINKLRYEEINRPIHPTELSRVRQAAEQAGLWRFCDPVAHDGFQI